jgi:hypothetical protein
VPIGEGGDGADLGKEPSCLRGEIVPLVLLQQLGIKTTGRVDHRGENRHGMRAGGKALELAAGCLVQQFVLGQLIGERPQLHARGQLARDNQVRNFYKSGFFRQLLDRDATVTEDSPLAINESDFALARPSVAKTVIQGDTAGLTAERGNIYGPLLFRAFDYWELACFSIHFQFRGIFHTTLS